MQATAFILFIVQRLTCLDDSGFRILEQGEDIHIKWPIIQCTIPELHLSLFQLAWITSQVEIMRGRTEILAQDITEAERSFASVKSELDLLELHGLLKRQQDIEVRSLTALTLCSCTLNIDPDCVLVPFPI